MEDHRTIKRTRSEWKQLCDEWETSGLKQPDFCKQKGINYGTFIYWRTEFGRKESEEIPKIVPLKLQSTTPHGLMMHISLPTGVKVALPIEINSQKLLELLNMLGVTRD